MAGNTSYEPNCLPDLLPIYYKRLFPYSLFYRWLHYGGVPKTYFSHREFSFTLKDDVYLRYQSFSDQQEMEKEIQKRCPHKIDIGAIFSHRPKDHKTVKAAAFQALEKELVFDIDMTDYDDVRFCCSGAEICLKCWTLMQIAIKILDRALREDFGFRHILWVYSGRRGVHCWVCDPDVRKRLQQKGRTAVAEYLNIVRGGENMTKKVNLREGSIHPSIQKAIQIVRDCFEEYAVNQQDFLGSDSKMKKVLALIPDDSVRSTVEKDFKSAKTSRERWQYLQDRVNQVKSKGALGDIVKGLQGEGRKCACVVEEIMLQYCYPRLDINVSKGLNHLLKSPFCVHPKTGRVCVPISHERVDEFSPLTVPTISQLCNELDQKETAADGSQKTKMKDMKQTSLKDCLVVFENFVKNLEVTWKGKLIEQSDMDQTF